MWRRGRACVRLSLMALASAAAMAPSALGEDRGHERSFDPTPPPVSSAAEVAPRGDDVIEGPPRLRNIRVSGGPFQTPTGETIHITVSDYYLPDPAADQAIADFLGSLLHGSELDGTEVFVVGPPEITQICQGEAAACYFPDTEELVIVGEESFGGVPTAIALAHEYGHHIANNRRNPPFSRPTAVNRGTKRWFTKVRACPAIARGRLDPSDYYQDPGEAFAESYAFIPFPSLIPWDWDNLLAPSGSSHQAITQDTLNPWRGNTRKRFGGRLRQGQIGTLSIRTPLDGRLKVSLRGPRRADFDLYMLYRGRTVAKSTRRGSRERIGFTVCGESRFKIVVHAYRGKGRLRGKVFVP